MVIIEYIAYISIFSWICIGSIAYIGTYIIGDVEPREFELINKYLTLNGDFRKIEDIEDKTYSIHLSSKQYFLMRLNSYKLAGKIVYILLNIWPIMFLAIVITLGSIMWGIYETLVDFMESQRKDN